MDPQGRLLLEQTGLALGDAWARAAAPVPPGAGVYVGVMHMEYIQFMDGARLLPTSRPMHVRDAWPREHVRHILRMQHTVFTNNTMRRPRSLRGRDRTFAAN